MIRLRKNSHFKRVYTKGKSAANGLVVVCYAPNGASETRIGFSVSKRIGKAVVRNHTKRLMRECLRNIYPNIKKGFDVVFVARKRIASAKFGEIAYNIEKMLKKADML